MRDGDSGSDAMFDALTVVARACGMCLRKDLMSLWCIKEAFVPGLETFVQV